LTQKCASRSARHALRSICDPVRAHSLAHPHTHANTHYFSLSCAHTHIYSTHTCPHDFSRSSPLLYPSRSLFAPAQRHRGPPIPPAALDADGAGGAWHYPCSPTGGSSADLDPSAPYRNPAAELAGFQEASAPSPAADAAAPAGAAAAPAAEAGRGRRAAETAGSGGGGGRAGGGGGVYKCAAVYPSAEKSRQLGRKNLHLFRWGGRVTAPGGRRVTRVSPFETSALRLAFTYCHWPRTRPSLLV
jgi:hypothetical protein